MSSVSGSPISAMPMRPVAVDEIEQELTLIWREAANSSLASGGGVVARNSVLSLVVFAGSEGGARAIINEIEYITRQIASRAVVIITDQGRSYGTPFDVSVGITQRDASGAATHGEQILIKASEEAVRHLPGTVLPLILSGLPSFLWWPGEPLWRTEVLEAMVDGCDRMIVDTSNAVHGGQALIALYDLLRRKKASCAITDLNWAYQAPWREMVAQFFDEMTLRPYLNGIDRISIEYAAGDEESATNAAQAYLFAGWLASRLGWLPQSGFHGQGLESARQHFMTNQDGKTITLEINARYGVLPAYAPAPKASPPPAPDIDQRIVVAPGALMSVHLHALTNGAQGTFAVAREADMEHASTLCQAGSAYPSRTVHLPSLGEASHIVEQLHALGHDTVYEEAIARAALIIGPAARR